MPLFYDPAHADDSNRQFAIAVSTHCMCLVEESLTTVEASCSTLKCSCSTGILPVGPVGILPADCSRAAINGQDARLPHRQDACATSEESLDHCGPRKHFTLPFFHNPGDWINRPYPLPHV